MIYLRLIITSNWSVTIYSHIELSIQHSYHTKYKRTQIKLPKSKCCGRHRTLSITYNCVHTIFVATVYCVLWILRVTVSDVGDFGRIIMLGTFSFKHPSPTSIESKLWWWSPKIFHSYTNPTKRSKNMIDISSTLNKLNCND